MRRVCFLHIVRWGQSVVRAQGRSRVLMSVKGQSEGVLAVKGRYDILGIKGRSDILDVKGWSDKVAL